MEILSISVDDENRGIAGLLPVGLVKVVEPTTAF